jgi:hypothetical protein
MLRKLMMLVCLAGATNAMAQNTVPATTKNTQNPADAKIDYKQMGAPMPSFTILPFHDTSAKKTPATAPADIEMTARQKRQAKKRAEKMEAENKMKSAAVFTDKDLNNKGNLFVMMFNPTCGHCTDQTQVFEKNIALFKKSRLVLMANPNMREYLPNFVKSFHTDDYAPIMHVGMDSLGFINTVFLYQALPQINVYSNDRKLIRTFTGEVSIDTLKKYID